MERLCATPRETLSPLQRGLASCFGWLHRMGFHASSKWPLEPFLSQLLVGYWALVYFEENSWHTPRMSIFVNHNHINVKENAMSASTVPGLCVE